MSIIRVKYAGRYDNANDGKTALRHLYISDDGKRLIFKGKLIKISSIGSVITMVQDTDGTYTQFKLTDERAEQSFIDEHVARDKAEFIEWTAKKNLAKVPKSKYDDVINDLRDVMRYLSATEKKALIVKILLDIL